MEFLKSGFKTVLGTAEPGQHPSAAETVEKLVDRVISSTLLDDRRDACRALKALSRKYRIEVGAQGMPALVQILKHDCQDSEIISYALDALCNITASEEFDEEADNPAVSVNVGEQFTEMFIKAPDHVTLVMGYLEEYDFRVRRAAIQLITTLIANKTRDLQEIILVSPMGVSKLMDLLTDSREVIRNDALLLLIQLTKGNSNIQKIVAFENAFDKIFEIIQSEGCSDGGIVVEDCLILLLNLLKNNSSNQQFFKEGSFIQRLSPMFIIAPETEEIGWSPQKVSNIHCMLQVVRALVTPSNQQQVVSSCQKVMRKSNLLDALCSILMGSGVPADILTETINAVAEIVRGEKENQDQLSIVVAPSNPPRPAIVVLLMSMINEKQMLALRCAVLYCFQCYLFRNIDGHQTVVQTLLPSSESEVSSHSTGQLLCVGLFSTDPLANWFSAVALMHALVDSVAQKEELLRVLLATPGGGKPITLIEQCTNLLQQDSYKLQSKVGLLMLLGMWLAHCPSAVKMFLGTNGTMAYLTAQISANEHDENEYLIQGLCAFLMGLCIQFNNNTLANQKRDAICQLVIKRIGQETFCNKLSEVSRHEAYSRACKQPQIRAKSSADLLLDFEYCKLYKGLEALIGKVVSGFDVDGIELTELTLSSEASALVAKYKSIIRDLDGQINSLQQNAKRIEIKNAEIEQKLIQVENLNTQLYDQNTLLKAQLGAVQNDPSSTGEAATVSALNSAQIQTNLYCSENIRLTRELETLRKQLEHETNRANNASDDLQKLQKDQDDLLELLTDQEIKINRYEQQLRFAGLPIENDEDTENKSGFINDGGTADANLSQCNKKC
ncbi:LOW QUALITY PROTEIN: general vesicular transport factor p115 [Rhagoletis pomonella]|uniref:LOW QUALITY PROTEIN: general vesicular transport factor p115 n=1 Tax=Rhagoletis pomonella TaxID=28610 RepID=UPI0017815B38|nr:LOW QUALITY PROTEIN: general vesicular transport factor p115 [Rhagoletis pomonella]